MRPFNRLRLQATYCIIFATMFAINTSYSTQDLADWPSIANSSNIAVDLAHQLFLTTNNSSCTDFGKIVCKTLPAHATMPELISFKQISFVFHYPIGSKFAESISEMSLPDKIINTNGKITCTNSTVAIPVNYIRLLDPNFKHMNADVDLLVGISPLEGGPKIEYFRRTFQFVYDGSWKYVGRISR